MEVFAQEISKKRKSNLLHSQAIGSVKGSA